MSAYRRRKKRTTYSWAGEALEERVLLAADLTILSLGDSITQAEYVAGVPARQRPSYRFPLQTALEDANINFDFVGSQSGSCGTAPTDFPDASFDQDHEGHWGWRADELINGPAGSYCGGDAGTGTLASWISGYPTQPDFVLAHIGTNDVIAALPPGHTAGVNDLTPAQVSAIGDDIEAVVDELLVHISNPNLEILLATLIPGTLIDEEVQAVNIEIANIAAANPSVTLVDQYTGFDPVTHTYDALHPNAIGEQHMADRWFAAMQSLLDTTPPDTIPSTPTNNAILATGAPITLSGTSMDDVQVDQVDLVIYNEALQTWNGTAFTQSYTRVHATLSPPSGSNVSWSYVFTPPADGQYGYSARGTDPSGNLESAVQWTVFTASSDAATPETNTVTPTHHSQGTFGTPVSMSGTASDDTGVGVVSLAIYDQALRTWDGTSFTSQYTRVQAEVTSAGGAVVDWTYEFEPTAEGQFTFAAIATDVVGKNDPTQEWITVTVAAPPILVVLAPMAGSQHPSTTPVMFSGTVTDDTGVSRVRLVIYDQALRTWDGVAFTSAYTRVDATLTGVATSVSWSYAFAPPAPGLYTFTAIATDIFGKQSLSVGWRTIEVEI